MESLIDVSTGDDNDNDVYFTLGTSDSRIGKYKTVGEQLKTFVLSFGKCNFWENFEHRYR